MKRLILLLTMCLLVLCGTMAQEHYATCKVIEDKGKVKFEFSPETRYLGNDYERTIVYFDKKKLSLTEMKQYLICLHLGVGFFVEILLN